MAAQLEEDRTAIRTFYQNRGFADAEVLTFRLFHWKGPAWS